MKTQLNKRNIARAIIFGVGFMFISASGFAETTQGNSGFDSGAVLSVMCVLILAAFMFIAMFRAKGKDSRDARNAFGRQQQHLQRRQSQMEQLKYSRKWHDA